MKIEKVKDYVGGDFNLNELKFKIDELIDAVNLLSEQVDTLTDTLTAHTLELEKQERAIKWLAHDNYTDSEIEEILTK